MTKIEFIERTNIQVTDEQFDEINNVYMACPNLFKDQFCDLYVNDKDKLMEMMMRVINDKESKIEALEGRKSAYEMQLDLDAEMILEAAIETGKACLFEHAIKRLGQYRTLEICKNIFLRDYYKPNKSVNENCMNFSELNSQF